MPLPARPGCVADAPKGLGTKLPAKKEKKDKAAAAAGGEGGEGGEGSTPAAKKEKEAVPMQRVEAKSWEVGAERALGLE